MDCYTYILQLVSRAIMCAAHEVHVRNLEMMGEEEEEEVPEFSLTMPGIHLAFVQVQRRLLLFSQAVQLFPESVLALQTFTESPENAGKGILTEREMVCYFLKNQ